MNPGGQVTQLTFPLPINDGTRGFTFLEVLIALLIISMAVGVTASATVQIFRSEKAGRDLNDAALHLQTLACRNYILDQEDRTVDGSLSKGWRTARVETTTGKDDRKTTWTTWSVWPAENHGGRTYIVTLRERSKPSGHDGPSR